MRRKSDTSGGTARGRQMLREGWKYETPNQGARSGSGSPHWSEFTAGSIPQPLPPPAQSAPRAKRAYTSTAQPRDVSPKRTLPSIRRRQT